MMGNAAEEKSWGVWTALGQGVVGGLGWGRGVGGEGRGSEAGTSSGLTWMGS